MRLAPRTNRGRPLTRRKKDSSGAVRVAVGCGVFGKVGGTWVKMGERAGTGGVGGWLAGVWGVWDW